MAKVIWSGVSAYAAGAYDRQTVKALMKCYPKGHKKSAMAFLYGTWNDRKAVKVAARFTGRCSGRDHLYYVCISNECSRRTGRNGGQIALSLDRYDYRKALEAKCPTVIEEVKIRTCEVLDRYAEAADESTHIWLQVGLEDNLTDKAAGVLLRTVKRTVAKWRKANPGTFKGPIKVIRNAEKFTGQPGNFVHERHGRNIDPSRGQVHNFDGVHVGNHEDPRMDDIGFQNAQRAIKNASGRLQVVFLWSAYAQGWKNQPAQPYEGRTYVISPEEIAGFQVILRGIP